MLKYVLMHGLVIKGSRNLFTLKPLGTVTNDVYVDCRLKSKMLKLDGCFYNPLAPGDIVEFSEKDSLIESLVPRRNKFSRHNAKENASQIIAANIDIVLCVTSPRAPPFRPRFIDRILLQTEYENIEAALILNKSDIVISDDIEENLNNFEKLGIKVFRVSANTGEGFTDIENYIIKKTSLLIGQSGVGKSSILNRLLPNTNSKIGTLNKKYERGTHTTVLSILYENKNYSIIDSPGVRQFIPDGINSRDIALYMKEITPFLGKCYFGVSCTHTHEEGCAIRSAVEEGVIYPGRYESFLKLSAANYDC